MTSSILLRGMAAALLFAAHACAVAQVAVPPTYQWSFSGDVSQLSTVSFESGGKLFDTGLLALEPMDLSLPRMVEQGDTIEATILLSNGPFGLPASPEQLFGFNLNSPDQPVFLDQGPPVVSGRLEFLLNGTLVRQGGASCGNCASLIFPSIPGSALEFDEIRASVSFDNLTQPYEISSASISYQLSQPVPEPGQWALLVAGLAGVGALARRRALQPQR